LTCRLFHRGVCFFLERDADRSWHEYAFTHGDRAGASTYVSFLEGIANALALFGAGRAVVRAKEEAEKARVSARRDLPTTPCTRDGGVGTPETAEAPGLEAILPGALEASERHLLQDVHRADDEPDHAQVLDDDEHDNEP